MQLLTLFIFSLELTLLLTHEMDAIRKKEWRMFIILKNMPDEKASYTFMLLHIPLYTIILMVLFSGYAAIGNYIVDVFLIVHMFVHFLFRNHPANQFTSLTSKLLIYGAGVLAVIHILLSIITN